MTTISIITAVYDPRPQHVTAALDSIISQQLPDGWTWQWIVQEDGHTGILSKLLPRHPQISIGTGRRGGAGVARTLALSRATGDLVRVLDIDDQLTPCALARDIQAMTDHLAIGWATSRALDLMPDGSTVGFAHDPPAGTIAVGAVLAHWEAHDYRAQVHPATLCIRRDLLLALGGWMALPASEDTGLLLAANALTPGYFTPDVGLLYRKWPGQATAQPEHQDPTERGARMQLIAARARALHTTSTVPSPALAYAGVAGALIAMISPLSPSLGVAFAGRSFAVVVLGGLGNPIGTLMAGLILGLAESLSTLWVTFALSPAVAFVLLILVLIVRPTGLFKPLRAR